MNDYEKMVSLMRNESKKTAAPPPVIGLVVDRGKIKLDSMELDTDDYLINCNLRLDDKEKVYWHKEKPSGGEYLTDGQHNGSLKEYKDNILQKGDKVLMLKLDGFEKYILIAKVVKPT